MKYRKEIDGLRAIAVVPVILFHAGFSEFSGGFVGVDVFFVISGYLITTIILSEKENGTFSLVNFYERRARRIIPALFLVLLISTLLSWLWLSPWHMKDFSQSLVAVSLFSSNILFWKKTGYWGVDNELKPLLHTWSLAVEEQYYVLFPLFLMIMWRFRKRWMLSSFLLVAIASLLFSQWAAFNAPTANFFLLPTRLWELAIGAGIAFYLLYRKNIIRSLLSHKVVDELLGWLGLSLIGYAVFIFDENTPFPSVYALVPTIGTALVIIFSSKETIAGKLLGSKLFVGVGLISYSAYLWHQPLFAFARHRSLQEPSSLLFAVLSVSSLLIAFISWKYVETPFRKKGVISRKHIFSFTALGSIAFIAFGSLGHYSNGFLEQRYSKNQVELLRYHFDDRETLNRRGYCFLNENQNKNDFMDYCRDEQPGIQYFIWGDSFAASLWGGFDALKISASQFNASGCPPIIDIEFSDRPSCNEINEYVLKQIEASTPDIILLHANWFRLRHLELSGAFSLTLRRIRDIAPTSKIYVIGNVPIWGKSLPEILFTNKISLNESQRNIPILIPKLREIDAHYKSITEKKGGVFISALDVLCSDNSCYSVMPTKDTFEPSAWDYGHMTPAASSFLVEEIIRYVAQKN